MDQTPPRIQPHLSAVDVARLLPLGDLLALSAQSGADISPETLLQDVADALRRTFGLPRVYVRLRNADTDVLEACAFAGVTEPVVARLRAEPVPPGRYQALLQPHYQLSDSYLVPGDETITGAPPNTLLRTLIIPLRGRGERMLGAIFVAAPEDPATLDPAQVQVLEAVARQAGLTLEHARLAARMQRLLTKEQLLVELGRDVSTTLELEQILERTIDHLRAAFRDCAISLLNGANELEIAAASGELDDAARRHRLKIGEGICGWVVQTGQPFLSNDIPHETRVRPALSASFDAPGSYVAVPLRTGGKVIGTLSAQLDSPNGFTYEDVDLLEAVAAQIGGPIAGARLYQEAQRLAEQIRRRNKQLEVINALARMAVSTIDIQRMLQTVALQIQQGFGYGHVEVFLIDEAAREFVLAAQAGMLAQLGTAYRQNLAAGVLGRAFRAATTVRVDDVLQDAEYVPTRETATRSELCVPIVASGRVLGLLNLESRRIAAFGDEDVATLETVADVLASAIENARLYQRAQEAAVLEERSRLARDLHDSVSQQLFSMTLTAQAARSQLGRDPARSMVQLERLQETAAAALAEMRALIFQLRPPGLSDQGLIATLQQHVSALRRREGMDIELTVTGEAHCGPEIEQAIYRIVQEALNNVIKHASASHVTIALELTPHGVQLRISDDGCGFDLALVNHDRHLGLISMRERAAEIGGTLDLHTRPGIGTEIIVNAPLRRIQTDASATQSIIALGAERSHSWNE